MNDLIVTLYDGGVCEQGTGTWEDVQALVSILEPGCGYTAILVQNLQGKEVLGTMIRN